jgi:hypothetical protein
MASARQRREGPVGDPAFREDTQLTHEPIREEERGRAADGTPGGGPDLRNPQTWLWPGVAVVIVGLGVVAGATAGWAYMIPFVVLGALIAVFFGSHGAITRWRRSDSIPHFDFGERAEEPEQEPVGADSSHQPHADPRRGPGRR